MLTQMKLATAGAVVALLGVSSAAIAQDEPVAGGTFRYGVENDPTTMDCHAATSVFTIQHLAPHYSTLLRYKTKEFPAIEGDIAESWSVSDDNRTYTFKIRDDVVFHNGEKMTAEDVRVSLDRVANPPEGLVSPRESELSDIVSIEAPDPQTLVITLSEANPTMLTSLANPWNCIYSSKLLDENPDYPTRVVMGTGPFVFEEFVPGSYWNGVRFDDYFREGLPYLDRFEIKRMETRAIINAIAANQLHGWFRQLTPPQRQQLERSRGDEVVYQSTPSIGMNLVALNVNREPFGDERVRRALTMAIDREEGSIIMGRTSFSKLVGAFLRPGYEYAMTPEELEAMPGFSSDIETARAEARELLKEAGVEDLQISLTNRNLPVPNIAFSVFLVDQWQRIGVSTEVMNEEDTSYFSKIRSGDFDVAIDFNVPVSDDPTIALVKYLPGSPTNYVDYQDDTVVELYEKQKRMLDPAERKAVVQELEQHLLNKSYYLPLHWAERTIPLAAEVRGFTVTPNNQVGQSLETVWFASE